MMAGAKLVVLYPYPADVEQFERVYTEEHLAMVSAETMPGIRKFIGSKIIGTADGAAPAFYRVAELHFDSLEALQNAAQSEGARAAIAHAASISTGGVPLFLVAQEEITEF